MPTTTPSSLDAIDDALRALFRGSVASRMHERLKADAGVELDRPGMQVLSLLGDGPLRISDVALRLGLDLSTVSRKVAQLGRAGLVERGPDPSDRRAAAVGLSEPGRAALTRIRDARASMLAGALDGWPDQDQADLARLLCRFAGAITAYGDRQ